MATLNPYLNFNGNTEEAIKFYQSVFGGELMMMRFKDTPQAGNVPDKEKDKLMHASLPLGKENVLMASDSLESMGMKFIPGNNFYISVGTASKEEADKIFKGLSAGGKIEMPISDQFWGSYFGMLSDKFGVKWMVSFDKNPPQ